MIKRYFYFVIFLFLLECSLNPNSKFWTEEKKILVDKSKTIIFLNDDKKSLNEFNQNFKISLPKNLKVKTNYKMNNDGYINFDATLEKMSNYPNYIEFQSFFATAGVNTFERFFTAEKGYARMEETVVDRGP